MSKHVIHAELYVEGCTAEVYLNGIPLRRCVASGRASASIPAHEYLVPGVNALELVVEPGPTPSTARARWTSRVAAGSSAKARLVRREARGFGEPLHDEEVAAVTWKGDPHAPTAFPSILHVEEDLGPLSGRWSWQDAPPITLDDATRAEIAAVLATVASAFESGRPSGAIDLLQVRFADHARAYPEDNPRTPRAEMSSSIRRAASEGWSVRSVDPSAHDFRLCADGRLVEILDRSWLPSLRFASGATVGDDPMPDEEIPFPMMLARIDGRLCVVR